MNHEQIRERSAERRESFGELLRKILGHSKTLVQNEIELVKRVAQEEVQHISRGAVKIVIGAAIGLVALMALSAALVIVLTNYMGPEIATLITGIGLAVIGLVLALIGVHQLKTTVNESKEKVLH
jgi:hypothetical protein